MMTEPLGSRATPAKTQPTTEELVMVMIESEANTMPTRQHFAAGPGDADTGDTTCYPDEGGDTVDYPCDPQPDTD